MEVGSAQVGKGERGSREIGITKVGITKVSITQSGEVEVAEVRPYLWMLFPPLIPNVHSLHEDREMVLVCHMISLLSFAVYDHIHYFPL